VIQLVSPGLDPISNRTPVYPRSVAETLESSGLDPIKPPTAFSCLATGGVVPVWWMRLVALEFFSLFFLEIVYVKARREVLLQK
jgi:hypothetical protein